jgi:hypothetical protein
MGKPGHGEPNKYAGSNERDSPEKTMVDPVQSELTIVVK